MIGKIKWFNSAKGYGFIEAEGKNIFVHTSNVEKGVNLPEGTEVEFDTEETDKGLQAVNVKIVKNTGGT